MTQEQFNEISNWQKETFGNASPFSKLEHLCEEIIELKDAIEEVNKNPSNKNIYDVRMEFADTFMLLFGCAASYGLSYQDICGAIGAKHDINLLRKWGNPDANGVVKHIK